MGRAAGARVGERSACGMYSRSSFTKPMSSLFHASGLRVRIDTVCPASAASAAKMGVELPPPTTVICMLPSGCGRFAPVRTGGGIFAVHATIVGFHDER